MIHVIALLLLIAQLSSLVESDDPWDSKASKKSPNGVSFAPEGDCRQPSENTDKHYMYWSDSVSKFAEGYLKRFTGSNHLWIKHCALSPPLFYSRGKGIVIKPVVAGAKSKRIFCLRTYELDNDYCFDTWVNRDEKMQYNITPLKFNQVKETKMYAYCFSGDQHKCLDDGEIVSGEFIPIRIRRGDQKLPSDTLLYLSIGFSPKSGFYDSLFVWSPSSSTPIRKAKGRILGDISFKLSQKELSKHGSHLFISREFRASQEKCIKVINPYPSSQ